MHKVCLMVACGLAGLGCSSMGARSGSEAATAPVPPRLASPFSRPAPLPELNRLIEDRWQTAQVTPVAPASDGEFLRRVTLDLAGRIPTLAEAKAYLADNAPEKRTRLVDRLLASHDFTEHWADVFSDLFWSDLKARHEQRQDPRQWLVKALAENMRYDRLAYEVLTASGELQQNGATAFYVTRVKGGGGPESVAGAAARIFLGLQIQCAQCHDHPYDPRWKQEDFYGLVAYFARTKVQTEKAAPVSETMAAANMMAPAATAAKAAGKGMAKTMVVFDVERGNAKMRKPRTEKDVVVQPRFLGYDITPRPNESRRQQVARAIIASDLFAKSMVARTWTQLFGHGIVDPWDDLGGENDPKHPALLVRLSQEFRAGGFDLRWLLKTITLSTAYSRTSARELGSPEERSLALTNAFGQAGIRPLSPEQLFRSLLTATGTGVMARKKKMADEVVEKRLAQALREYAFVFADDEMAEANTFDGSMPQSLLLLNGELTNRGVNAGGDGVLGQILKQSREPAERVDDMFLAAYARKPDAEERTQFLDFLGRQSSSRRAYEDLYFALITSTEAITNH